jgi:hypothetical protein
VLLVDDEPRLRAQLGAVLADYGVAVLGEAGTGQEGVDLACRLLPDVVLMDLRMPELDGIADHLGDLGGVGGPDDRLGSAVEPAVEQCSCLVVVGVVGGDHPTVDGPAQPPPDRQGLGAGG